MVSHQHLKLYWGVNFLISQLYQNFNHISRLITERHLCFTWTSYLTTEMFIVQHLCFTWKFILCRFRIHCLPLFCLAVQPIRSYLYCDIAPPPFPTLGSKNPANQKPPLLRYSPSPSPYPRPPILNHKSDLVELQITLCFRCNSLSETFKQERRNPKQSDRPT